MVKIKILYGIESTGGGALKHLVYLATRLDREIFDITIILSNNRKENINEEVKKMSEHGVKVLLLPMHRNINLFSDIKAFIAVIKFLNKHKFDIVHAHSSKAGGIFRLGAYFCKVKSIFYTPHCFYFQSKKGIKKYFFIKLEWILGKITSAIIVSESEQKEILRYNLIPKVKIVNINNAIDFNEYKQYKETQQLKNLLGIKSKGFIVGAIGRLAPQKDWETYIYAANEVLKRFPETIFLIIGEGELRSKIQKLIFKLHLNDNIILTGYVRDIYKVYGIIDIFVNTSLYEGLPYVFLEAMNYKKPIIATSAGNNNTIVNEENGFIIPVKDHLSIAEKINLIIENKHLGMQIGEKGMELLSQKYSFKLFIKKHEELYRSYYDRY